ncbi:MAG: 1,4-dihydroxy-2-naphthoate polyprenyltransferase [Bacteroides sp.]|nr:1,4-dihydroxy-2-naphthoate polyprenyltransferase [Bacteroides sp.]
MDQIKPDSLHAWWLASRPKTLTGALVPVLVGSALAYSDGKFDVVPACICSLFACLMQIAANLINDLFDFLKGSDREDRLGPERACSQGWISPHTMKMGIAVALFLAAITGSALLRYGGWELILVGAICMIFAFLYTTGSYPLSYHGWGDVLVLIFFGLIPVGGTYYVQAHGWNANVTIGALVCGLAVDTLLIVNNYRDRDADQKSGKRTIVVRFGETCGSYLYLCTGLLAGILCIWFAYQGNVWAGVLPQLYLIPHIFTWKKMIHIHSGRKLNSILGETSRNMLFLGILLCIGLLMG